MEDKVFGLTQREQRWAAEERGIQMVLDHKVKMQTAVSLAEKERLINDNLRLEKEILEIKSKIENKA